MLSMTYKAPETPEAIAYNETVTATRKQYKNSLEALITAHNDSNSPKATVEATIATIGYEMTEAIIATITNAKAWDGRISDANKEWAAKVDECLTKQTADKFCLYSDDIHPAHLDQIADAMRNAERPDTAPGHRGKPTKKHCRRQENNEGDEQGLV